MLCWYGEAGGSRYRSKKNAILSAWEYEFLYKNSETDIWHNEYNYAGKIK